MSDDEAPANDGPGSPLQSRISLLQQEHSDLDHAIEMLEQTWGADQLSIARMKKRKLAIKDQIIQLQGQLRPDIIA